jgi:hypothetical protein
VAFEFNTFSRIEMLKFSWPQETFDKVLIGDGVPVINPDMAVQSGFNIPYPGISSAGFAATLRTSVVFSSLTDRISAERSH